MKEKKIIILFSIVIILMCTISAVLFYSIEGGSIEKEQSSKLGGKMIVSSYYENFAWGYSFSGIAIFDDGSIYSWNANDNCNDNNLEDYVIKCGKKEEKSVSSKDLKQMKKYVSLINDKSTNFKTYNFGNDMGEYYIYIYKNNKEYLLYEYGDWSGTSDDPNAQELITIIEKYAQND